VSARRVAWYRQRWIKIIGFVVALIITVAVIAACVLYALWQSRPERALLDAAQYAVNTPATYKITSPGTNLTAMVNDQRIAANGTFHDTPLSAVYTENTLYVKSPQPEKLYQAYFADSVPVVFETSVKSLLANLKDRWISIDLYKLPSSTGLSGSAKCGIETINQLTNGSAPEPQVALAYAANQFVDTKTIDSTPIQTTYRLSLNQSKLKTFYAEITKLDAYKNQICSSANNPALNGQFANATVDATVTRPDHHLRELLIHEASNKTTKVQVDYAKVPAISVPTDAVTYDQIAGSLLRSLLTSFIGSR